MKRQPRAKSRRRETIECEIEMAKEVSDGKEVAESRIKLTKEVEKPSVESSMMTMMESSKQKTPRSLEITSTIPFL